MNFTDIQERVENIKIMLVSLNLESFYQKKH